MEVHGSCDPKFQPVRQEFERNFRERGEVGASVCITLQGKTVVDLWGGLARADTAAPEYDSRAAHAAEIGAAGGITNARGLAGMYAPLACGGKSKGVELVNPATLARMALVSSATGRDAVLVMPTRFALGFMKSMDNRRERPGVQDSVLISEDAFGHVGAGGSFGFADPKAAMSFGYTMNRMGPGASLNERGQSLVDATYRVLGYQSDASGAWK